MKQARSNFALSHLYAAVRAGLVASFGASGRRMTHIGPTSIATCHTGFRSFHPLSEVS